LMNKKQEMEREFIELNKRSLLELGNQKKDDLNSHQRSALERELFEGEKIDLQKKIKLLNRKIEELTDDIKILEE
jgi:hypothetical protein